MATKKTSSKRTEMATILATIENRLTALFGSKYQEVLRISQIRRAIEAGEDFTFESNPAAARQTEHIIQQLAMQATSLIKQGDKQAWEAGDKTASKTLAATFGKTTDGKATLDALTERGLEDQRQRGATAAGHYRQRQEAVTYSTGVWKEQALKDIELLVQNGIKQGKSAEQISRDIRPFLNNPTAHYRRVKNKETGELELSAAAKAYHPGAGVYRSAFKNALRLARTEVNIAYATAQWEAFQSNPLVTGIRIRLSNNHTVLDSKGKPQPLHDMCDELQGDYPKTFRWTPWHPQCRCTMTPITISDKDFKARMKALFSGALDDWKPQDTVTKMPETFTGWMERNKKRLAAGRSIPAFIRDNFQNGNPLAKLNPAITQLEAEVQKQAAPETKRELTAEQQKMKDFIDNRRQWTHYMELTDTDLAPLEEMMNAGDRAHFDVALQQLDDKIDKKLHAWSDANNQLYHEIEALKKMKPSYEDLKDLPPDMYKYFSCINVSATLGEKYDMILKEYDMDKASKYTVTQCTAALRSALAELQDEKKQLFTMEGKRRRLQEHHERHKNDTYSPNMPESMRPGGSYIADNPHRFSNEFFDLLDPERPVEYKLLEKGSGSFSRPWIQYVEIDKRRGYVSAVERATVIYHEVGHVLDYNALRTSVRLGESTAFTTMYEAQRKRYMQREKRNVTMIDRTFARDADGKIMRNPDGSFVYKDEKVTKTVEARKLYFAQQRLEALCARLMKLKPETLAKYGVTREDIREAHCSVEDLIMSINPGYGRGHAKNYMSKLENRTTEYLAHAFEATFQGNALLQKVMPDVYQEILAYIKSLPAYWEI